MKRLFILITSLLLVTSALFAEQKVKYERPFISISSITHLMADECKKLIDKNYSIVTVSGDEETGYTIIYDTQRSKKQYVIYERPFLSFSSVTHLMADKCTELIKKGYKIVAVSADEDSGYMIVYE